jgi:hypothetical protein
MLVQDLCEYLDAGTCVKIYDPENKKLIGVFSNYRTASKKLGVTVNILQTRAKSKKRIYIDYYNKDVAVRFSSVKEGDGLLIDKTLKNKQL